LSVEVLLIKPVAGPGVGMELLPKLTEFKPLGHTLPELIDLDKNLGPRVGRMLGGFSSRRHWGGAEIIPFDWESNEKREASVLLSRTN
jgi:hypothetical protein